MTVPNNAAVALSEHYRRQGAETDVFEFDYGESRALQPYPQIITVIAGCAWITLDEHDIILKTGAQFRLTPGRNRAVISSANRERLVYSVEWKLFPDW